MSLTSRQLRREHAILQQQAAATVASQSTRMHGAALALTLLLLMLDRSDSQQPTADAVALRQHDPCQGTGISLTAPSGSLKFIDDLGYTGGKTCIWTITCPAATSPVLLFSQFFTELTYDYVQLYDGGSVSIGACAENRQDDVNDDASWCDDHIAAGYRRCDSNGYAGLGPGAPYARHCDRSCHIDCPRFTGALLSPPGRLSGQGVSTKCFPGNGYDYCRDVIEPGPYAARSDTMRVYLTTDGNANEPGFAAAYTCENVQTASAYRQQAAEEEEAGLLPSLPTGDPCYRYPSERFISADRRGAIEFYTVPVTQRSAGPADSKRCHWTITCPSGGTPTLRLNWLDTEAASDYVSVWDGRLDSDDARSASTQLSRLSGTDAEPKQYEGRASGDLTLEFLSDPSVVGSGFSATYDCAYGGNADDGGASSGLDARCGSQLAALAPRANAVCCAESDDENCGADGGLPEQCSAECASLWAPFQVQCPAEAGSLPG
eukprot:COSAG03_NODE_3692_length_1875_cov_1.900338_1_plen_489_part_10